jgi:predicted RNA-binding protein YlqC (UPF0109 family)
MKDLLEHIVKSIVNEPGQVVIEEKESVDFPGLMILNIKVAEGDKGVVIGRKGRTINAIRDIMTIHAIRINKRIRVMLDEGENGDRRERREDSAPESQDTPEEGNVKEDSVDTDQAADDMLEDEI